MWWINKAPSRDAHLRLTISILLLMILDHFLVVNYFTIVTCPGDGGLITKEKRNVNVIDAVKSTF